MMLPEMTSSARVARAFQRFARGAVVGLALGVLAACGGGGSSKPATPQMTITPGGDTLANAVDVTGKETTEGRLDSPDDIQYYQWEAPEDGTFEFTLEADAGLELAILDSGGNVITTAETASPAEIQYTLEKGRKLYFRISDAAKKAGPKVFKFVAKNVGVVQTLVNFIKGDITVELTVAGRGVTIDLNDFVSLPDGADTTAVTITLTTPAGVKLTSRIFQRLTFRLDEPPRPFAGVSHLSVCYQKACSDGVVNLIIRQAVTVKDDYWGSKDEVGYATRGAVEVDMMAGGSWSSQPLGEYFNSPDNTQLSFAVASSSPVFLARIQDSRLVVGAALPQPQRENVVVSATGPQNSASLTFRIKINENEEEEEEEPGGVGVPVAPSPETPQEPTLMPAPGTPAPGGGNMGFAPLDPSTLGTDRFGCIFTEQRPCQRRPSNNAWCVPDADWSSPVRCFPGGSYREACSGEAADAARPFGSNIPHKCPTATR